MFLNILFIFFNFFIDVVNILADLMTLVLGDKGTESEVLTVVDVASGFGWD